MIDLDFTLWIQAVNFLIILFFLNIYIFKPVLAIAEKRNKDNAELERHAKENTFKTEKAMAEYEQRLTEMRRESAEAIATARKEASAATAVILEKAQDEFRGKLKESRDELDKQVEVVSAALQKDVKGYADTLASRILGEGA